MKTQNVFLIAFLILTCGIYGQPPEAFNYQAVIRNTDGVVENTDVNVKIEIIEEETSGTVVYSENHEVSTNDYGLVNLKIGEGTTSDTFSLIVWTDGPYFIRTSVNDEIMGTQQLLSVPYAIASSHAAEASSIKGYHEVELKKLLADLKRVSPLKVTDYDGNTYPAVVYGDLLWMAEDLKVTHFPDGDPVPLYDSITMPWDTTYYNSFYVVPPDSFNGDGLFYTSVAAYDSADVGDRIDTIKIQGICPDGWRLPNGKDFNELLDGKNSQHFIDPYFLEGEITDSTTFINFNLNGTYDKHPFMPIGFELYGKCSYPISYGYDNELEILPHYIEIYNDKIDKGGGGAMFTPVRCVKDLE
jgi:uncharacterized protein (TIGR02145 family)